MNKYLKIGLPILIPLVLLLMAPPAGLSLPAWRLFALYIGAILGLMLRPAPEPAVMLIVIAISSIFFKNTAVVLAGFASTTAWLVFSAFMLGQAFVETGLGKRIAYLLIDKFGRTTLGLGYVAAVTDMIISPATPSNTARTGGLVYPIFRSIAVTLDSHPGPTSRRLGAYLSLLIYQISITTASMFLTASAVNLLATTFAKSILKVEISWLMWAQGIFPVSLLMLIMLPYIIYKLYPPELKEIDNHAIAQKGLKEMGPITRREKTLAVLFVLAVIGWATGTITKIDATAVAIGFVAACLATGVVNWGQLLASHGAWSTLMWYGAIISFADGLTKAGFFAWLTKVLAANISFAGYSPYVIIIGLMALSLPTRYFFASQAPFNTTMLPLFFTLGAVAGVPPIPLAFALGAFATYGCLLTHYGNAVAPVLFGPGYVDQATWWKIGTLITLLSGVVFMTVGMAYWKLLGWW